MKEKKVPKIGVSSSKLLVIASSVKVSKGIEKGLKLKWIANIEASIGVYGLANTQVREKQLKFVEVL